MRYMYHATPYENASSILNNGIRPGATGAVYMCEHPNEAIRFLIPRQPASIAVFKIKILKKDEQYIKESFDHNIDFFKCRAFGYVGTIPTEKIISYEVYGKA